MRFLTVVGIVFYASVIILIGVGLIFLTVLFSLQSLPFNAQDVFGVMAYAHENVSVRIITGLVGLLLILISSSFAQLILGKFQREKTIAFSTSAGEVTVALSAIEDLIKRLSGYIPEIRELRPDVKVTKKGIEVELRVVLKSEANIPDMTGRLQELVRSKIQEVLGVEEQIMVKIHIAKIITLEEKDRKRKDAGKDDPIVPYGGYGRA